MRKNRFEQLHEIFSKEELSQLEAFSEYNKREISNWLDEQPELDPKTEKFNQVHHLLSHLFLNAAESGDADTIKFFLGKNIYQNKRAHTLHGALRAAKDAKQEKVVKLLVEYGVEPQKKLQYETITDVNGVLTANLFILNRYNVLELEKVKSWFNDELFKGMELTQLDDKIRICVKNVEIYKVLNVLRENFLVLDDKGLKALFERFKKIGSIKTQLRRTSVKMKEGFLAKYKDILLAFDDVYNQFFKTLSVTDKAKIYKKRPTQLKEKPADKNLIDRFVQQVFLGIKPEEMSAHIAGQWVANAPSPKCDVDLLESTAGFVNELNNYNIRSKLKVENLSDESKVALQNIIVYGEKLWKERDAIVANTKQRNNLVHKIEALSVFIRDLVRLDEFTEANIKKLYNALEQSDVNRGTGFYSFFTAAKGMWYTNDKGQYRPVKSTLGELGFYVMSAFVKQAKAHKEEVKVEEEVSQSEKVGSTL